MSASARSPRARSAGPALDHWIASPTLRVVHSRESSASPEALWSAACSLGLGDAPLLGRVIRWRIPGLADGISFDELFHEDPFLVLDDSQEHALLSGLVGKIWTLRRDYPHLASTDEFRQWSVNGTARVLFANWVTPAASGRSVLQSETRVQVFGAQARIGLATLRPVILGFQQLIGSDAIAQAVRRAERNVP
jgi:hypothetical protein